MRTLIEHVSAITLDADNRILTDASIALQDGWIAGLNLPSEEFVPDERIDGSEMVALPAFFNAHTHAAMTLERGWAEDLDFPSWLNEKIWVAESALEEEDVYWGAALAVSEMLRAGAVGFGDHYFWMDGVGRVVEESGVKALLAWCHFGGELAAEPGQKSLDDTLAFARRWKGAAGGRIRTALGPHSPYMVPDDVLRKIAAAAAQLDVGVHLHVAESRQQVEQSIARYGLSPVAHINSTGLLDLPDPALFAHCNVLVDGDMEILAGKRVGVAFTPKTYQKLAMQMPDLPDMIASGVNAAFGTDGPASNSDLNMLEVMRIAGLHFKQALGDPRVMPRDVLLRLATQKAAAVLGFGDSGMLAAGSAADLILFDTHAPHWIPRHDLAAGVVYGAHPGDVAYVWCNGKLLYRKGDYLTLDIERIRWEAERRAFRMVGRNMASMRSYPVTNT